MRCSTAVCALLWSFTVVGIDEWEMDLLMARNGVVVIIIMGCSLVVVRRLHYALLTAVSL